MVSAQQKLSIPDHIYLVDIRLHSLNNVFKAVMLQQTDVVSKVFV